MGGSPLRQHATMSSPVKSSPAAQPFVPLNDSMRNNAGYGGATTASYQPGGNSFLGLPPGAGDPAMYFRAQPQQMLQYHLYSSLPPHRKLIKPNERVLHDFFINDKLRETLQKKQEAALLTFPESTLPNIVSSYHSLVPLDTNGQQSTRLFGYSSWVYKAVSRQDGTTVVIRRIEGFRLTNEASIALVAKWRKVVGAGLVTLREAFTTKAFSDSSLCFVYDYHPLSETLHDHHFGAQRKFGSGSVVGEKLVWSYLVQLVSALRTIHRAGLACRTVEASKILVTEKNRIRLSGCGVLDVLAHDEDIDLRTLQRRDLYMAAYTALSVAANNANIDPSDPKVLLARGYSEDLVVVLRKMLGDGYEAGCFASIDEVLRDLAQHLAENLDSALQYDDTLESELGQETENGRLVRLLTKLAFVNERPEYDGELAWGESGGRYMLKLFRDYVFHQVDEQGDPVVDMGHVLACLNKLDAGTEERINLVSRDESSCMIVSYRELKQCAQKAFLDLKRRSNQPQQHALAGQASGSGTGVGGGGQQTQGNMAGSMLANQHQHSQQGGSMLHNQHGPQQPSSRGSAFMYQGGVEFTPMSQQMQQGGGGRSRGM